MVDRITSHSSLEDKLHGTPGTTQQLSSPLIPQHKKAYSVQEERTLALSTLPVTTQTWSGGAARTDKTRDQQLQEQTAWLPALSTSTYNS